MRPEVDFPDLAFYFKSSLRFGLGSLDILVREAAAEVGLDSEEIRGYLTENLHFLLREPERQALAEFYRRAREHGLLPAARELVFAE